MAKSYETGDQFPMSQRALEESDRETQLEVMESWFRRNYEDPAERTPYESAEGGYIWIWGGPYDTREVLEEEFGEVVDEELIEELADELERDCLEWAPAPSPDDYDNSLIEDVAGITEFYQNFSGALLDVEKLLDTEVDPEVTATFHRLLYVNVITAMETYLSDAFISTVVNSPALMRRFIETTPEFLTEKISLADVFKAVDQVEQRARTYLADVVWHHLHRVKPMYRATLEVEFPTELGPLFGAIMRRHDIVHRNGKTKTGEEIVVTREQVGELIELARRFVQELDRQLAERDEDEPPGPIGFDAIRPA